MCCGKKQASVFVGAMLSIIMALCIMGSVIQLLRLRRCKDCPDITMKNVLALVISTLVYYIFMLLMTFWFLWGAKNEKASVVISYFIVSLLWWIGTFCLMLVLMWMYQDADFTAWIVCTVIMIIFMGILLYGILVVFCYWKQLKARYQPAVHN